MKIKKKITLWYVNLGLLVSTTFLFFTGLVNWLFLPRGSGTCGINIVSMRHFIRDMHELCSLIFIVLVVIHVYLHKDYIAANIKKTFDKKN